MKKCCTGYFNTESTYPAFNAYYLKRAKEITTVKCLQHTTTTLSPKSTLHKHAKYWQLMSRYFLRSCLTDPPLSSVYFLHGKKGTLENSHVHTPTSLATMNLLYPYKYRKTPAVSPLGVDLPQKKEDSSAW